MRRYFMSLLFGCLLTTGTQAQEFINTDKSRATVNLEVFYPGTHSPAQWKGDSLKAVITDSLTVVFVYDARGLCESEIFICPGDMLFTRQLEKILGKTKYQWKRLNENQFVSRFEDGLLLEISPEPPQRLFTVIRAGWTREIYELLLKQE